MDDVASVSSGAEENSNASPASAPRHGAHRGSTPSHRSRNASVGDLDATVVEEDGDSGDDASSPVGTTRRRRMQRAEDVNVGDATGLSEEGDLSRASTMVMPTPSVLPLSATGDAASIATGGVSRHSLAGSFVGGSNRSSLQERMTARMANVGAAATASPVALPDGATGESSESVAAPSATPAAMSSATGTSAESAEEVGATGEDAIVAALNAEVAQVLSNDGCPLPSHVDWDFDAFAVGDDAFPAVVYAILRDAGVVTALRLQPHTLLRFADAARERYWPTNAFHNAAHGLHVCQAVSRLLTVTGAGRPEVLPPLEVFALLISALCHDIDHPGTSNGFLSAIEDELALRYNDQSVLENHHAALTCELMRDVEGGTDVVSPLSPAQRRRVRQVVITSILGTDMSKHFGYCIPAVKALELPLCARSDAEGKPRNEVSVVKERDRLHEILLHTADLTGQVLSWTIAEKWSDAIVTEFRSQASMEIASHVPITPHMHNINTPGECAELQSGFCDYVLAPLWRAMADVFPQLTDRVEQLESNSARYKRIIAEERSADAAASTS